MLQKSDQISKQDHSPGLSSFQFTESRIRNDRQAIFDLTRQLVHAQFELADQELTNRLWEEVIQRNIEIERILNLMYRCTSHEDENEMLEVDLTYQNQIE